MKRLCFIVNKKIKWLEKFLAKTSPDSLVLYSGVVFDRNFQTLRIREHDDGELYMNGKKLRTDTMDYMDCHELYEEIPDSRYIYLSGQPVESLKEKLADATVIVMPNENTFESYLAIAMFLKTRNIDMSRTIHCLEMDNPETVKAAPDHCHQNEIDLPYFETKFAGIFRERKAEGFISLFPITRDIRYLQMEAGMSNIEFAAYFNTSVRNVENWRKDPKSLKDFIYDLFEYKLLKEGVI